MSEALPVPAEPAPERVSLGRLLMLFLRIGALGFGGGMAVIALMERDLIQKRRLLSLDQFLHGVGLGQILGSFAVNTAFFVGFRLYGVVGAVLSASAFLLPSLVLVTGLSHLYFRYHAIPALDGAVAGLGPVVIALIADAGWSIGQKVLRSRYAVAIGAAALIAGIARINAVWILAAAGAAGLAAPMVHRAKLRSLLPAVLIPAVPGGVPLLVTLAVTFLKIGLVFFGGGFVLIPVLHQHLVNDLGWLTAREFIDGVAISNLTPGPIAILSTFAGYHLAGVPGAVVATLALMAPAMALNIIVTQGYERFAGHEGVQRFLGAVNPAVAGLVLSAAVMLGGSTLTTWREWAFAGLTLLLMRRCRWHPAIVLACGAAAGYAGLLR